MNRLCMFLALVIGCSVAAAIAPRKPLTPEEAAQQRERVLRHTGGLVERPGSGLISIINIQERLPETNVVDTVTYLKGAVRANIGYFTEVSFTIPEAESQLQKHNSQLGIYIVEDSKLPMSLVAIEARWALINVAALVKDSPNSDKLASRFRREFVRVSSILLSGCTSQYKGSPLQSVTSLTDLDALLGDKYSFDFISAMSRHLPQIGITPTHKTTYRKACEEGWAPPPVNDYQKDVWNLVKAEKERGPSKAIQIKP